MNRQGLILQSACSGTRHRRRVARKAGLAQSTMAALIPGGPLVEAAAGRRAVELEVNGARKAGLGPADRTCVEGRLWIPSVFDRAAAISFASSEAMRRSSASSGETFSRRCRHGADRSRAALRSPCHAGGRPHSTHRVAQTRRSTRSPGSWRRQNLIRGYGVLSGEIRLRAVVQIGKISGRSRRQNLIRVMEFSVARATRYFHPIPMEVATGLGCPDPVVRDQRDDAASSSPLLSAIDVGDAMLVLHLLTGEGYLDVFRTYRVR
jgi:hypothetical protein